MRALMVLLGLVLALSGCADYWNRVRERQAAQPQPAVVYVQPVYNPLCYNYDPLGATGAGAGAAAASRALTGCPPEASAMPRSFNLDTPRDSLHCTSLGNTVRCD